MPTSPISATPYASFALSPGASPSSSPLNLIGSYGATIFARITNPAVTPSSPATIQLQTTGLTATPTPAGDWYDLGAPLSGSILASGEQEWVVDIPFNHNFFRAVLDSATGASPVTTIRIVVSRNNQA